MKLSIQKLRTKEAVKFNNYAVKVDDILVGIIGKKTIYNNSEYTFFSKTEETKEYNDKTFVSLNAAKDFFKHFVYLNA